MSAQFLPAKSSVLTQMENSLRVVQDYPEIIGAVNYENFVEPCAMGYESLVTPRNIGNSYCRKEPSYNKPHYRAGGQIPDYRILTSSGLCCLAGYAASCPSVKSNLIALYGNTIFPWSSWSMTPAFSSACTSRCTPRKSRPMRRASSRIDTAPVPVMALMICNRPTPNMTLVSDSTSGNVRENGTSTACPDIAATKDFSVSSHDSLADITRTTSVLITLPPEYVHIVVKLADKVIQSGDRDGKFTVADVLMVTLSGFVVVAHNTYILNDISKAVFVVVLASPDRWIDYPYRDTGESVLIREVVTFFNEQISRHVFSLFTDDNYDINISVMSTMSSKALDRLNCWRYSYPAPHKTGAGRGNPILLEATPDAASVFFVVRYTRHSMAWCAHLMAGCSQAPDHATAHRAALIMVTLAGLPKGRPVPSNAGISTPVNVTALFERGNSSGDSLNLLEEAVTMATTLTPSHPLFVWRFYSGQNLTYLTTTATSEREARLQLPAVRLVFVARIRLEAMNHA